MKRTTIIVAALALAGVCHAGDTPLTAIAQGNNTPCGQEYRVAYNAMAARIAGTPQATAQSAVAASVHNQVSAANDGVSTYIGDSLANSIVVQAYTVPVPTSSNPSLSFALTTLKACNDRGGK